MVQFQFDATGSLKDARGCAKGYHKEPVCQRVLRPGSVSEVTDDGIKSSWLPSGIGIDDTSEVTDNGIKSSWLLDDILQSWREDMYAADCGGALIGLSDWIRT